MDLTLLDKILQTKPFPMCELHSNLKMQTITYTSLRCLGLEHSRVTSQHFRIIKAIFQEKSYVGCFLKGVHDGPSITIWMLVRFILIRVDKSYEKLMFLKNIGISVRLWCQDPVDQRLKLPYKHKFTRTSRILKKLVK